VAKLETEVALWRNIRKKKQALRMYAEKATTATE
jgi:hypothetical protein